MKLPLWINLCRVEERSVRLAYKTKMVTDWQKTLGIRHNQSVTGVLFPQLVRYKDYVGIAIEDA